ncbi:MAG: hypothetical protein ACK56I_03415, partial [bacterium]
MDREQGELQRDTTSAEVNLERVLPLQAIAVQDQAVTQHQGQGLRFEDIAPRGAVVARDLEIQPVRVGRERSDQACERNQFESLHP